MKKLLFGLMLTASFGLTACGGDDEACKTCELSVLTITTSNKICPSGDGVEMTIEVAGQSTTQTVPSTTVEAQVSALETQGYTCK